jgi:hypothetical protein
LEISVIIVNWNTKDLLLGCLKSVFQTIHGIPFEVWLVDNGSTDGSVQSSTAAYPAIKVIRNDRNLGFAAANNQAFQRMTGRYALLLNTDAALTDGAVEALYGFMETHPQTALACGQLLNEDGSKQNSIANFPSLLTLLSNETVLRTLLPGRFPSKRREYTAPIEIESCIGACMMARKKAMEEVGFLDERFFFFFEETDWAFRMKRAGWQVYFVPQARIFHRQGQSVGHGANSRKIFYRSRYLYFRKWHSRGFPLFFAVILARLVAETLLSFLGALGTLGLNLHVRARLGIYLKLIIWHLSGCP